MIVIGNTTDDEIAKVLYGEGGVFVGKNHSALVAIAQCILDEWRSGLFGDDLQHILNFNFYGRSDVVNDECLSAVEEVFVNDIKRFADSTILQFRSFTKYSDGNGNIDPNKCSSLLKTYDYLGSDSISNQWGHLYFGYKEKIILNKRVYPAPNYFTAGELENVKRGLGDA